MVSRSRSGGKRGRQPAPRWARVLDYCFGGLGYVIGGLLLVVFSALLAWFLALYFTTGGGDVSVVVPDSSGVPSAPVGDSGPVAAPVSVAATAIAAVTAFAVIVAIPIVFGAAIHWFAKVYSAFLHRAAQIVYKKQVTLVRFQGLKVVCFGASFFASYLVYWAYPASEFFTIFLGLVALFAVALLSVGAQTIVAALARRPVDEVL